MLRTNKLTCYKEKGCCQSLCVTPRGKEKPGSNLRSLVFLTWVTEHRCQTHLMPRDGSISQGSLQAKCSPGHAVRALLDGRARVQEKPNNDSGGGNGPSSHKVTRVVSALAQPPATEGHVHQGSMTQNSVKKPCP